MIAAPLDRRRYWLKIAKIERVDFSAIAKEHDELWPDIAKPIAERLRQRNDREREKNKKPRIFIGSSSESASILTSLASGLKNPDFDIVPWTKEGIFTASSHVIEDLEKESQRCDFAIFIFGPDDKVLSRWRWSKSPRDNVIFELGLFMGALGRQRAYIVQPQKLKIKTPSDLLGLTSFRFDQDANEVCNQLIGLIKDVGPR